MNRLMPKRMQRDPGRANVGIRPRHHRRELGPTPVDVALMQVTKAPTVPIRWDRPHRRTVGY